MKVDTHGMTMIGLAQAAKDTHSTDARRNIHLQISYDTEYGKIYTNLHVGESWSQYREPEVITIGHTYHPMSEQRIADWIAEVVAEEKALEGILI